MSTESPASNENPGDGPPSEKPRSRKLIGLVAVVVLFIACGYSSFYDFGLGSDDDDATDEDGEITIKIAADIVPSKAELEARTDYVPAVVSWWDGIIGCGWVEWDAIEAKLPRLHEHE